MRILYFFVILYFISAGNILAGDIDVSSLTKLLGSSNAGKEFYFTFIPAWEVGSGNGLKLYISSNVKTRVTVEVVGKGYSKTKYTIPNDIIEFTLVPAVGQTYRKTDWDIPQPDQVFREAGVHVIADDPIICLGVTRYNYTSDAFLALPVHTLGKEYIVASYADVSNNKGQWLPSYTGITAAYDKTKVLFTMGGTDSSRTAGGLMPGQTSTWNLNRGDVLLIGSLGHLADLSGSKVVSTKPVSVVSGNFCAYIPSNCGTCDFIEEMELPTQSWGIEYHVSPIVNRLKNSIIKVLAKEAKTKIYRDYQQIGFLRNAGGTEQIGYMHLRADEGKVRPIVISGDKPINVTQFNTGQQDDNIVSDPFQMVLVPVEQYQKEITFHSPGIKGGYGFPYNYINLCYESDALGNIPNDLEIAFYDYKDSVFNWYKLIDTLGSKGTTFSKSQFGKQYSSTTIKLPGDGVYKIKAGKPIQAYVYGFSSYDSYGHPASANLKRLDINDSLPPKPEWVMNCYGNVNTDTVIYVKDMPEDINNRANIAMVYLHSDISYNYKLELDNFMPCADTSVAWRLEVIDNSEDALAVVTFADCAGNDTTIVIEFDAVKLGIEPKIVDYGLNDVNVVKDKMFYLVNRSTTKAAQVNYLKLKMNTQNFILMDSNGINQLPAEFSPPIVIQPLDSMPFLVKFTTSVEGEYRDSIGIGDTCIFRYIGYISAMAGTPIIDVSDWDFPPTQLGNTAYGSFDIKNNGTVTLEIYDYFGPFISGKVNGNKIYTSEEIENQNITPATPLRLRPNETRTFQVKFTPDDQKSYPDSIVFITNSIKDPQLNNGNPVDSVTMLSGTGVESDLTITSYNWERKRIHRTNFSVAPYPALRNKMNPDTAIKLYNGGTAAVTINRLIYTTVVGDTSAFRFNRMNLFRTLNPGEEVIVPVTFQPTMTGPHLLTFRYETSPVINNITTTLQGVGIVPRLTTDDINFGKTIIGDYDNYITHQMTFANMSYTDWQYGDSVIITNFREENIYTEIESSWDDFPEPFRYDKADKVIFDFPIVLQPGELITFDADFVAKDKGMFKGFLTTVSDAEKEVTSEWTGYDSEYVDVEENGDANFFSIFPNPAEGNIQIYFKIKIPGYVNILLTDILGKERTLVNEYRYPGEYMEKYDLSSFPQGLYNLILHTGYRFYSRKIQIIR